MSLKSFLLERIKRKLEENNTSWTQLPVTTALMYLRQLALPKMSYVLDNLTYYEQRAIVQMANYRRWEKLQSIFTDSDNHKFETKGVLNVLEMNRLNDFRGEEHHWLRKILYDFSQQSLENKERAMNFLANKFFGSGEFKFVIKEEYDSGYDASKIVFLRKISPEEYEILVQKLSKDIRNMDEFLEINKQIQLVRQSEILKIVDAEGDLFRLSFPQIELYHGELINTDLVSVSDPDTGQAHPPLPPINLNYLTDATQDTPDERIKFINSPYVTPTWIITLRQETLIFQVTNKNAYSLHRLQKLLNKCTTVSNLVNLLQPKIDSKEVINIRKVKNS